MSFPKGCDESSGCNQCLPASAALRKLRACCILCQSTIEHVGKHLQGKNRQVIVFVFPFALCIEFSV